MSKKGIFFSLGSAVITTVSGIGVAFAGSSNPLSGLPTPPTSASSGPGTGLYNTVIPQLITIFLLVAGVFAVWYFMRSMHTKMITLIVSAIIVLVILTDPQALGGLVSWVGKLFSSMA